MERYARRLSNASSLAVIANCQNGRYGGQWWNKRQASSTYDEHMYIANGMLHTA